MSVSQFLHQSADILSLMPNGGPGICNISVTNVCNARCDFCNFALDKGFVSNRIYVDYEGLCEGLDILHREGIRYLTFSGGEPLLHPDIHRLIAHAVSKGMRPSLVTNGYLLSRHIDALVEAGLKTIFISLDAPDAKRHNDNRGLSGLCERIHEANQELQARGVSTIASVTINKLIDDFGKLPDFLRSMGFDTVTFSYPKTAAPGTSSLVYSETSSLVDYPAEELISAFRSVKALKKDFTVLNPSASLDDMITHLEGGEERFPCLGGFKYFYLDWNLQLHRCDTWSESICHIRDFTREKLIRDGCTQCMSDCYRDASVLLHLAVSTGDAIQAVKNGALGRAGESLFNNNNRVSVASLLEGQGTLKRLAATKSSAG